MNNHAVAILTLSRYPDIFSGLQDNLDKLSPGFDRVLVKDGYLISADVGWMVVQGPTGKFNYSANVNVGLAAIDPEADVFLIGDDVRLKDHATLETLHRLAYSDPNIGLLSPRVCGGADNPAQTNPNQGADLTYTERYIALVATYIKRSALKAAGYLDSENFKDGWGWDDVDFSRRVRKAGLKLAVTSRVEVNHGLERMGSETLIRNERGDTEEMQKQDEINAKAYFQKWGDNIK